MGLLSDDDFNQIKSAIKQVTDTFGTVPVEIIIRQNKVSAFNQSRDDTSTEVIYNINALAVYETDESGKSEKIEAGTYDMTEGFLLVNYEDLRDAGLINADGLPAIQPNKDSLKFKGRKYEIEGAPPAGPLKNDYAIVKILFKYRGHGQK